MRTQIAIALTLFAAAPAMAQEKVRIGYVNTFSGSSAFIGQDQRAGFELALEHLGRKMGGLEVEVFYEDDQLKPETGKQVTDKLIQTHKVHFLTGYNWSNVLLASYKSALDAETFIISSNAGPSQIAGELCSPWFFSTSWQNDQTPMALGEVLNRQGVKKLYTVAANYPAGRDMVAGVKRTFKGEVVGEDYTKWPDQLDFSGELSKMRAAAPEAIFTFFPGAPGIQFLIQFSQAGLKGRIPLYTVFSIDGNTLPLQKDLALGVVSTQTWVPDLSNPVNKRFVEDFRKKHNRYPSYYTAQNYDAAMLINSAVVATKGNLADKQAVRAALRKADFEPTRGPWQYNHNHIPISDFWLQEVMKDDQGAFTLKTVRQVSEDQKDPYHEKCPMKW